MGKSKLDSNARLTVAQQALIDDKAIRKVTMMAQRTARKVPVKVDDLESAGYMGLVHAAATYDPTRSSFHTWCGHCIQTYMTECVRQEHRETYNRKLPAKDDAGQESDPTADLPANNPDVGDMLDAVAIAEQLSDIEVTLLTRASNGDSLSDIARDMGLNRQTVHMMYHRVVNRVKKHFTADMLRGDATKKH